MYFYTGVLGWLRAKQQADPVKLQADLDEQRKQVSNLQKQVDGLLVDKGLAEKKYEECNTQRIEAGNSADGFRKQLNDFVAKLASLLGTRQETVEIVSAVETAITFEDKASQLDRTLELERKEHAYAISALEKELATLKSTTEAKIIQLEGTIKELKYSSTTPTQPTTKLSIIDIIKKVLGI